MRRSDLLLKTVTSSSKLSSNFHEISCSIDIKERERSLSSIIMLLSQVLTLLRVENEYSDDTGISKYILNNGKMLLQPCLANNWASALMSCFTG